VGAQGAGEGRSWDRVRIWQGPDGIGSCRENMEGLRGLPASF
jgi:hypothetical protein